jgi:hypothetical protein
MTINGISETKADIKIRASSFSVVFPIIKAKYYAHARGVIIKRAENRLVLHELQHVSRGTESRLPSVADRAEILHLLPTHV